MIIPVALNMKFANVIGYESPIPPYFQTKGQKISGNDNALFVLASYGFCLIWEGFLTEE